MDNTDRIICPFCGREFDYSNIVCYSYDVDICPDCHAAIKRAIDACKEMSIESIFGRNYVDILNTLLEWRLRLAALQQKGNEDVKKVVELLSGGLLCHKAE